MDFDPNQPINPNDLTFYEIDLKFLLEELEDRLSNLQAQTAPANFPNDAARGFHAGQIADLMSTITLIKTNMYPAPKPIRP